MAAAAEEGRFYRRAQAEVYSIMSCTKLELYDAKQEGSDGWLNPTPLLQIELDIHQHIYSGIRSLDLS